MVIDRKSPAIIVDTREKKPLVFPDRRTRKQALKVGDYTLYGYGQLVVVEYKSLPDWVNWISYSDRHRFEGQIHKLLRIPYRCVVVGGRLGTLSPYSNLHGDDILTRAAQVTAMGIPVIFCSGRTQASKFTVYFLEEGARLC